MKRLVRPVAVFLPAAVILLSAGAASLASALGASTNTVEEFVWGFLVAIVLQLAAPLIVIAGERRSRALWVFISVSSTATALILGFAIWAAAVSHTCQGPLSCLG